MPAIKGSIPDAEVATLVAFIEQARELVGEDSTMSYNDFVVCLLLVGLGLA